MSQKWMKLVALAAFFSLSAACSTFDIGSIPGKTGQLSTSAPTEAKSVNCERWNKKSFLRRVGVGDVAR